MALLSTSRPLLEPVSRITGDVGHKHEYDVRNLGTRSVTLFPTYARIIRDIKNVPLRAGINQVTIIGLTPTLDERSVRVEATNYAIITNLEIKRLRNKKPSEETDNADLAEQDDDDDDDDEDKFPTLKDVKKEIRKQVAERRITGEAIRGAKARMEIIENFKTRLSSGDWAYPDTPLENIMNMYQSEREKAIRDQMEGEERELELIKEILLLQKKRRCLHRRFDKARAARDKKRRKERWENEHARKEQELRQPEEIYAITVDIDVDAVSGDGQGTYDLTLSYATTNASWSPVYDIALSTATNSGVLYYDAFLVNQTSETWNECSIVLSTLETNIASHDGSIPTLRPWLVSALQEELTPVSAIRECKYSEEERVLPVEGPQPQEQFGTTRPVCRVLFPNHIHSKSTPRAGGLSSPTREDNNSLLATTGCVSQRDGDISEKENVDPAEGGWILETPTQIPADNDNPINDRSPSGEKIIFFCDEDDGNADDDTIKDLVQPGTGLEEPDAAITYDLVGLRSIPPSMAALRHRVARITDLDVMISRIVVPKHKRDVCLRASIRNDSKLSLLKGMCGFTIDGRFLGRCTIPRWLHGHSITGGLGIEPSIHVIYPKPEFSKEKGGLYTRTITLVNTQGQAYGRPVQVTVLDQLPICKDESVQIVLKTPAGLRPGGVAVPTGESADDTGNGRPWGKAEANMRRDMGEVEWAVTVNAGRAAKLRLEYTCAVPRFGDAVED
ncbi:hypothetical protein F5Y10DRAFT_280947 [Nemania abortiva]|nr:hypothetical protein F5Y10DRAFT_280947 [Nemania abortiva]